MAAVHTSRRTGITHAPVYPPHPLATSPSQLAGQQPRRPGQTGGQRRRGQRRQHSLLARSRGPPGTPYSSPRDTPASPRPPPRLRPQPAILTRQPPTASRVARRAHARRFGAEDSACGGTGFRFHRAKRANPILIKRANRFERGFSARSPKNTRHQSNFTAPTVTTSRPRHHVALTRRDTSAAHTDAFCPRRREL